MRDPSAIDEKVERGEAMSAIIGRREFLAGAVAFGLMPRLGWAKATTKWPNVQALLDRYLAEKQFAGMSAALSAGGEPVSYVNVGSLAFGSKVAADENTLWRIYSMSKPITAAGAMILIEDGKLALDQPVGDVLPALKSLKVATDPKTGLDGRPARNPMTMRHLMTHTAGLTYQMQANSKIAEAYFARGITPGTNGPMARDPRHPRARDLSEMIERLGELPLIAEPGTIYQYSIGLDVMGAVIERVSGKGFDVFLKERLFDPLDMASTGFQVAPKDLARLSTCYQLTPPGQVVFDAPPGGFAEPPGLLSGGGGMVSSARDYARFGQMLLGRGALGPVRVMKSETVAVMMSDLLPPGVKGPEGTGYGAGGRVVLPGPTGRFGAPGSYGWGGHASTQFTVDPAQRRLLVFMTQRMPSDASPAKTELPAAIAKDVAARAA
jgi:CubicO group peptidase (beta-lactamase class C family)